MPITPSRIAADPQAPLGWKTSVSLLALEKIKHNINLTEKETSALKQLNEKLALLSEVSLQGNELSYLNSREIPSNLHDSFFTLVAINDNETLLSDPPLFDLASKNLQLICDRIDNNSIDSISKEIIDETKKICLTLLAQINKQRPSAFSR